MNDTYYKFEIWGQPQCAACDAAKRLLYADGREYEYFEIGSDNVTKEDFLKRAPGARSVPQIFINNHHIGGLNELKAYLRTL
jgi:glutaredoxin 3